MKICILLSGHLRTFEKTIENFKTNVLDVIKANNMEYDIYIHTWDDNYTNDKIQCNDQYFDEEIINITTLCKKHNVNLVKLLIENQDHVSKQLKLDDYLNTTCKNRTIRQQGFEYTKDYAKKLFWQFYGHKKSLELVDDIYDYKTVIKTRPDMYYEKFDIKLLNNETFFPDSHRSKGNINQLFFGGKTEYMVKILNYFSTVIYDDKGRINLDILNKYNPIDMNFNRLFNFYIVVYLNINPIFVSYDPCLYRTPELIRKIDIVPTKKIKPPKN